MKEDNYDFVETDLPNVGPGGMVIPLPNVIDENEILDDEHDALLSPLLGSTYPVLPVFNAVLFPCVLQAVMLTEDKQIDAVSNAMSKGQYIVATTYIGSDPDTPITPGSLAKEGGPLYRRGYDPPLARQCRSDHTRHHTYPHQQLYADEPLPALQG